MGHGNKMKIPKRTAHPKPVSIDIIKSKTNKKNPVKLPFSNTP
jgi:hypothetical protein